MITQEQLNAFIRRGPRFVNPKAQQTVWRVENSYQRELPEDDPRVIDRRAIVSLFQEISAVAKNLTENGPLQGWIVTVRHSALDGGGVHFRDYLWVRLSPPDDQMIVFPTGQNDHEGNPTYGLLKLMITLDFDKSQIDPQAPIVDYEPLCRFKVGYSTEGLGEDEHRWQQIRLLEEQQNISASCDGKELIGKAHEDIADWIRSKNLTFKITYEKIGRALGGKLRAEIQEENGKGQQDRAVKIVQNEEDEDDLKCSVSLATNLILYGPPGTGKTYATLRHAVGICDGESAAAAMSFGTLRARYETLREAGRIAFVTFHQSFSYEDFVEGLRPMAEEGGAGFRLVPTPGILRRMADLAAKGRSAGSRGAPLDLTKRGVFKMSLGQANSDEDAYIYQECLEDGFLLLGYGGEVDWSDSRFDVQSQILAEWQMVEPRATGFDPNVTSILSFRNDLKVGDIVIVSSGNLKFRAIGEVTGPYQYLNRGGEDVFHHRRPVRWLWSDDMGLPVDGILNGQFSQRTVYRIPAKKLKADALAAYLSPQAGNERLPHVLVIDEINRANVSKVFGELITLLEEDKRAGAENAVTLRLPYSGEAFSLPPNLHILGTMNTADRSIALLDTALRRRFQFIEMPPRPDLLTPVEGLDLGLLLSRLNERIEYLYDRDHLIGHAFFIGAQTREAVDQIMRRKVLPLLTEYFHEDWERIIAVLGGPLQGFIERAALTPPPGLDLPMDEPRWRYLVRNDFPDDAYAGLQS